MGRKGKRKKGVRRGHSRPRVNDPEAAFWDLCVEEGYRPAKRGWPDFTVWQGKELVGIVEVKPGSKPLKVDQYVILKALSKFLPCYRWSPEEGFTGVGETDGALFHYDPEE